MKKLLIFGYTMDMGGAEKVLTDFLKVLNTEYEIDVALLKAQGTLMNEIPEGVNIIEMRKGFISYVLFRYIPFFRKRKINKIANSKNYDVAVGFLEGRSATWVADIKKSIRKLAWIHTDVRHFDIGISDKEVKSSYSKMDSVVFVSQKAKASFAEKYQVATDKSEVLYNLLDEKRIRELSKETVEANNCFTFVNVGRMSPPKRQDRLVEAAQRLKEEGLDFKIQIIGSGSEEVKIRQMITDYQVEDKIELLGLKTNPYPYVKQADCFVLCSDFEGFGIAVKEALLLETPVISTDVTGIKEVLNNGEYGILCDINTESVYSVMRSVLISAEKLDSFRKKLKNFDCSNTEIVSKLYEIIEGGLNSVKGNK